MRSTEQQFLELLIPNVPGSAQCLKELEKQPLTPALALTLLSAGNKT